MSIQFSVVVPLKNEAENVVELVQELEPVMQGLQMPWELICVDDGSTDATLDLLKQLKSEKPYLRIIAFNKNYGQSSAFDAGFRAARGSYIITMDGDRQNDPNDIPKLIACSENADLVCGQRIKRRDPWNKRIISYFANRVRSRFVGDGIPDTGCSLKLYRRSCFDQIKMYNGMHRFLPALFLIEGYKILSVPVNHRERTKGKTKYNLFNRSFNTITDMWAVGWMRKRRLNYQIDREL